jgi:hypothetical protein
MFALYLQVGDYLYECWSVIKGKKGLGICPWWTKVFSTEDVSLSTIKVQIFLPLLKTHEKQTIQILPHVMGSLVHLHEAISI